MSTFRPSLTYQSETKPTRYAVAVMAPNDNGVTGVVHFEDTSQGVIIKYNRHVGPPKSEGGGTAGHDTHLIDAPTVFRVK